MRFEKITDTKIKIIFTSEDMNINHISKRSILSENYISQKLLQALLVKAEQHLDFKVEDANLLVEAVSYKDGFIFTITKMDCSDINLENPLIIYRFDCFDNFLNFCTYIKNMNWSVFEQFSLLVYNNSYYLLCSYNLSKELDSVLCEFSQKVNYSLRF